MATPKKTAPTGSVADVYTTAIQRAPISYSDEDCMVKRKVTLASIASFMSVNNGAAEEVRDLANEILLLLDGQRIPYSAGERADGPVTGYLEDLDAANAKTDELIRDIRTILNMVKDSING